MKSDRNVKPDLTKTFTSVENKDWVNLCIKDLQIYLKMDDSEAKNKLSEWYVVL